MFLFQAGPLWFSILTRTGALRGEGNHFKFPADLACINSLKLLWLAKIFVLDMIMTFNFCTQYAIPNFMFITFVRLDAPGC